MYIFVHGFWPGFIDKRDAVDFSVFEYILTRAFEQPIYLTDNFLEADILLESHFSQSILFIKQWKPLIDFQKYWIMVFKKRWKFSQG